MTYRNQFEITNAILRSSIKGLTPAEKLTLATLSTYFGKNGDKFQCFPRQGTLAKELGTTRVRVNQRIKKLEQLGFISIKHQYDSSCIYTWEGIPDTELHKGPEKPSEEPKQEIDTTIPENTEKPVEGLTETFKKEEDYVEPTIDTKPTVSDRINPIPSNLHSNHDVPIEKEPREPTEELTTFSDTVDIYDICDTFNPY